MTKTTYTARTKAQLVAALARKGFDRAEVRQAADRAVDNGFAWAWGRDAGERCMALVTFSDTEVDMWDASLHTEAEIRCDVCNTMAHAPATLTQVDGIGNACRHCMRSVRDLDATAARWDALVESGKLDAEHTAESIAALRNLAAHLAPALDVTPCDADTRRLHVAHVNATLDYLVANDPTPNGSAATVGEMIAQVAAAQHAARCDSTCPEHGIPTDDAAGPTVTELLAKIRALPQDAGQAPQVDARHTVTHANGITQVFRSPIATRGLGESAVGAFQRHEDGYRAYNVDGSSLGTHPTAGHAYAAVRANDGHHALAGNL